MGVIDLRPITALLIEFWYVLLLGGILSWVGLFIRYHYLRVNHPSVLTKEKKRDFKVYALVCLMIVVAGVTYGIMKANGIELPDYSSHKW